MKTKVSRKYGANMDERESRSPTRFDSLTVDNAVKNSARDVSQGEAE